MVNKMFKIALNAGHYLKTSGKRCLKKLDKNETREWVLNNRICDMVEKNLKAYTGYSLLRIDDTSGKTDISVEKRAKKANDFGADIYLSLHHNAGIKGGKGGGIMVYTYLNVDETTKKLQKTVYDKLIKHTGLKGNRSEPLAKADFAECRLTKMPAVLIENGFMDSATDVPVILSEEFASNSAKAITEAIVSFGGLKKVPQDSTVYCVQVGAFANKSNAEALVKKLKVAGFSATIKSEKK